MKPHLSIQLSALFLTTTAVLCWAASTFESHETVTSNSVSITNRDGTIHSSSSSNSMESSHMALSSLSTNLITVKATLLDVEKSAAHNSAHVNVAVTGVELVDPNVRPDLSTETQAHLHYQVDNGPIIATGATNLSFHALSSGIHRITVNVADRNHQTLGERDVLNITVP